jgi:catechol 2,3-dioxygenase-like lactoylglutathione lyase family enzyme
MVHTAVYYLVACVFLASFEATTGFKAAFRYRSPSSATRLRAEASSPAQWSLPGYRKPLHWVQKVAHLEDALAFYEANFNFVVYRHEEFDSGCEATCNGPYGGAWSKTMMGPPPGEAERFCLELVCNYGVHRYERGSDLRSIAVRRSAFVGDADQVTVATVNGDGGEYVRTPDGHYIHLVEDGDEHGDETVQADVFRHISLHVTNLTRAATFYEQVLGARVTRCGAEEAVLCTWDTFAADAGAPASVPVAVSRVGVELRPLPGGVEMVLGEAHGRFAIETEDGAIAGIAARAQRAAAAGSGRVLHGPVALQPHGEEVVIIADDDGTHKTLFFPIVTLLFFSSSMTSRALPCQATSIASWTRGAFGGAWTWRHGGTATVSTGSTAARST